MSGQSRRTAALAALIALLLPILAFGAEPAAVAPPADAATQAKTLQQRIIEAAEDHLGKPYFFGGRDGRTGCRGVKRCPEGIDCQSLIFFAYEKVLGKRWGSFSVFPSISVKRRELGDPVPGLSGVLREDLEMKLLQTGDVLFFMIAGWNLAADPSIYEKDGVQYGVWHTGMVHENRDGEAMVIHARPGDRVVIQPLSEITFEALYVLRLPYTQLPEKGEGKPPQQPRSGPTETATTAPSP
ncbi:MAG TPA: hypothetical protein DFS52_16435 [Myxococcales bacterium]|nr:hypothetical protein [Myxococcales bacterium]